MSRYDSPLASQDTSHTLLFTGGAGEFTRIWWTNLLLTICTLGIYSAWAKVRTKKWFYGHTRLDGSTFNYHADPKAILRGRAIVVGAYVLLSLLSEIVPALAGVFLIAIIALTPWVIVRALRFNAINSSYRGVRFDFTRNYGRAYGLLFLFLAVPLTLGLAYPWWRARTMEFLAQYRYGTAAGAADVPVSAVYGIYIRATALFFVMIVVMGGAAGLLGESEAVKRKLGEMAAMAEQAGARDAGDEAPPEGGEEVDPWQAQVDAAIARQAEREATGYEGEESSHTGDATAPEPVPPAEFEEAPAADNESPHYNQDVLFNEPAQNGDAFGEFDPPKAAPVAEAEPAFVDEAMGEEGVDPAFPGEVDAMDEAEIAESVEAEIAAIGAGEAEAETGGESQDLQGMFMGLAAAAFAFYGYLLIVGTYIDARLTNLLWSNMRVRGVAFTCNLRARDLVWLRLTNALICLLTLFIAYPVTQVRNARYRLSRMTVEGDLNGFISAQRGEQSALGEEASDLLDIDIAL